MGEIGGYFEFETFVDNEYHKGMISINSGRNCLRYIIQKRGINKIYLPYFFCDVIAEPCIKENIEIEYYNIDYDFMPIIDDFKSDGKQYIYIINNYGLRDNDDIKMLFNKYKYIIIDNTQSFFQKPIKGIDIIYNCRKYLGVPDGAYLSTDLPYDESIPVGTSGHRVKHLVGRFEGNASDYYTDFKIADKSFIDEELMYMSKFTKNMLKAIDYDRILKTRQENIRSVHEKLKDINMIKCIKINNMTFMYPLLLKNGYEIRNKLIENKIYIPVLWPNVLEFPDQKTEIDLVNNIISIPIDQRYNKDDMDRIIKIIKENLYE